MEVGQTGPTHNWEHMKVQLQTKGFLEAHVVGESHGVKPSGTPVVLFMKDHCSINLLEVLRQKMETYNDIQCD